MRTELRQMSENQYNSYMEDFIPDYADDLAKNFLLPIDLAMDESKQLIKSLLPEKQETNNHSICTIYSSEENKNIGVIWFNIQPDTKKAFVYHIFINEAFRRKGYAASVLQQLEYDMKKQGVTSLGLSVFGSNPADFHLYKKLGYTTASIAMGKTI